MCSRLGIATLNGLMDETLVNQLCSVGRQARFQFSLRQPFVITAGVSVFFGFVSAGRHMSDFWLVATISIVMTAVDGVPVIVGWLSRDAPT